MIFTLASVPIPNSGKLEVPDPENYKALFLGCFIFTRFVCLLAVTISNLAEVHKEFRGCSIQIRKPEKHQIAGKMEYLFDVYTLKKTFTREIVNSHFANISLIYARINNLHLCWNICRFHLYATLKDIQTILKCCVKRERWISGALRKTGGNRILSESSKLFPLWRSIPKFSRNNKLVGVCEKWFQTHGVSRCSKFFCQNAVVASGQRCVLDLLIKRIQRSKTLKSELPSEI